EDLSAVESWKINTNRTRYCFLLANLIQKENSDSAFEKIIKGMVCRFKEMIFNGAQPQIVANLIAQIVHTKVPEIKYPGGEMQK
ncbi:MAG: hypothetical protein ACTHJ7_06115, partial [Candidatus Nitrosocosmicus sp.]